MSKERYGDVDHLIEVLKSESFEDARELIEKNEYSRWHVYGRRRELLGMYLPADIKAWIWGVLDEVKDSI